MAELAVLAVELETRGVEEAKRELDQFRTSADKAAVSVDHLEDATKDIGSAAQSMSTAVSRSTGTITSFSRGAAQVANASNQVGTATRAMAAGADVITNKFGLAAHQVTSFGSQIVDLGVQLSSGQGLFLPLIQQGPQAIGALGGVSRAAQIAKQAVTSIGPASLLAFGAAGVVGAIGAAAATLASFTRDLERTEAAVRVLNGVQGQGILDRAKASAVGNGFSGRDLQGLEQVATRNRSILGLIDEDLGSLTQSAAKLAVQMEATEEQSKDAISDLAKLLSGTIITGEQAIKFANAYPQFAGALAKAFDVPVEKLLDVDKASMRVTASVAQAIVEIGKGATVTPTFTTAMGELGSAIGGAALSFDKFTGLSASFTAFMQTTANEINGIVGLFKKLGAAADEAGAQARAAMNMPKLNPGAMNPGPPGSAPQNDPRGMFGTSFSSLVPDPGSRGEFIPPSGIASPQITAVVPPTALDPVEKAILEAGANTEAPLIDINKELARSTGFGEKGLMATSNGFAKVYDASKMTTAATEKADVANKQKLTDVERAVYSLGPLLGRVADNVRYFATSYIGSQGDGTLEDAERIKRIDENPWVASWSDGKTGSAQAGRTSDQTFTYTGPTPGYVRSGTGLTPSQLERNFGIAPAANTNMPIGSPAAGAARVGSITDPISGLIQTLRDQQTATLQRAYTPDPYKDKNPDWFYSGGKMYAAEQDKIFSGLEAQIDKLTAIATTSQQLLQQGQQLPTELAKALTAALIQAGMSGEQIAAALLQFSSTPTAAPTAQPGMLENRYSGTVVNRTSQVHAGGSYYAA